MQVHWRGQLSTHLPVADADVAEWISRNQPQLMRRMHTDAGEVDADQIAAFMQVQPHFANAARLLYARAHRLVPQDATPAARLTG